MYCSVIADTFSYTYSFVGEVHLTGYLLDPENMYSDEDDDDEEEDEEGTDKSFSLSLLALH